VKIAKLAHQYFATYDGGNGYSPAENRHQGCMVTDTGASIVNVL